MDWLQEELDDIYFESKLSPQDIDDLYRIEQSVDRINCYTDLLKHTDRRPSEWEF